MLVVRDCSTSFFMLLIVQDGVWIKGLYLEGAGWEKRGAHLVEASPMMLVNPIPTIHFKPVEGKKKSTRGKHGLLWLVTRTCNYKVLKWINQHTSTS